MYKKIVFIKTYNPNNTVSGVTSAMTKRIFKINWRKTGTKRYK